MVVTLEETKIYLRVDGGEEDALITNFISTAEELCEGILRYPLADLVEIPEAVKQSVLFAVGNLYQQRENTDMKSMLMVMTRLLFAQRQEEW